MFVEVKTRSGVAAGTPQEAVEEKKQAELRWTANAYLERRNARGIATRFDVIAIIGTGRNRRLESIREAF